MDIKSGFQVEDTTWQGLVEGACTGVAPLDSKYLKLEENLSLPACQTRTSSPAVSCTFSHNEMEFRAPRNKEQPQGFRQPFLPTRALGCLGWSDQTALDPQTVMVHLLESGLTQRTVY